MIRVSESGRRDSNSQQPAWKAGTLPLSYFRKWWEKVSPDTSFTRTRVIIKERCYLVKPPVGFEPTTYALQKRCSTAEL